jgi:hypothetical protein
MRSGPTENSENIVLVVGNPPFLAGFIQALDEPASDQKKPREKLFLLILDPIQPYF